jgi:hypothetical protein
MKPTREQIENATNEELRLWVAIHVMGWEEVMWQETNSTLEDGREFYRGTVIVGIPPSHIDAYDRAINPYFKQVPNYPVRIAEAWLVHEKILATENMWTRYFYAITKVIGARVHDDDRWKVGWPTCFGYLEPEDICRAALLAVLEEEEDGIV